MNRRNALSASALLVALGLGLGGCPDPTAGNTTGQGPGAPGGAPAGGPPGGEMGAGGPPPGGEMGAPPMGGAPGGAGRPEDARFNLADGEGVTLSGTFEYGGSATGQLRIDFLTMDEGGPPKLAHALSLEKIGEWSIEAPKDFGEVYIVAFVDKKGDGPSADDPAGRVANAVKIGSEDVSGLKIVLSDDADLGSLAPGNAGPPPGAGDPDAALKPEEGGQPGTGEATVGGAMPTGEAAPMPTGEATPMPTGEAGGAAMPTGEAGGKAMPSGG